MRSASHADLCEKSPYRRGNYHGIALKRSKLSGNAASYLVLYCGYSTKDALIGLGPYFEREQQTSDEADPGQVALLRKSGDNELDVVEIRSRLRETSSPLIRYRYLSSLNTRQHVTQRGTSPSGGPRKILARRLFDCLIWAMRA